MTVEKKKQKYTVQIKYMNRQNHIVEVIDSVEATSPMMAQRKVLKHINEVERYTEIEFISLGSELE